MSVLLCAEACRVHLGREWLVSVQDCVRGAGDEDGGGYVTSQNREPHEYNMIQARSLISMILTFKRLRQEDYCELLRPCFKERERK